MMNDFVNMVIVDLFVKVMVNFGELFCLIDEGELMSLIEDVVVEEFDVDDS